MSGLRAADLAALESRLLAHIAASLRELREACHADLERAIDAVMGHVTGAQARRAEEAAERARLRASIPQIPPDEVARHRSVVDGLEIAVLGLLTRVEALERARWG